MKRRIHDDERASEDELADLDAEERPRTRGDCQDAPRPCPWVGCAHNLYLDVDEDTGAIHIPQPDVEPWDARVSCALDVADEGPTTLYEIGRMLDLTVSASGRLKWPGSGRCARSCVD